jgi:glycosyltransferase EpsD
MEAMSCGLPVIGTENRGHRELIENNKTGWIVGSTNQKEFANKLILLGNEKELVKKLGENGRKTILTKYSTNKVLEEKSLVYSSYMVEMEDGKWAAH